VPANYFADEERAYRAEIFHRYPGC
jgi:hypothetical protein